MSEEQKEKNQGAIKLLEEWKNRPASAVPLSWEQHYEQSQFELAKALEVVEKEFLKNKEQIWSDIDREIKQQEDAHLELAIKYYTQGFEDARAKQPLSSTEYIYFTLDDALKARGLKP